MTNPHPRLQAQLHAIEVELKRLNLWQSAPPEASAFDSSVPFFADTMPFEAWIQWVLLPRFQALLDGNQPTPSSCSIAPMAEHLWKDNLLARQSLIQVLSDLDALFD